MDVLTGVIVGIRALLDTRTMIFVAIGLGWTVKLGALRLLLDAINGVGQDGPPHIRFFRFFQTIMFIAWVRMFLVYYDTPLPFWGSSFSKILIDESTYLTNQLSQDSAANIWANLDTLWLSFQAPSIWAWAVFVPYLGLLGVILFCKGAMLFVLAGSYTSFAVGIVLGPLFIPSLIFKETSWLFHGWFRVTLEFAFLPVVAMAYQMVMETFIFGFLSTVPPTVGVAEYAVYLYQSIAVILTMAFGTLTVPSLATSYFSGRAQHHHLGGMMLAIVAR